jgi:hypothetical protein
VRAHLLLTVVGIVLLVGSLSIAAVTQSQDLLEASVPISDISKNMRPWLMGAVVAQAILLIANVLLLLNFYGTACRILNISAPAWFNPPSAMETPST